MTFPAGGEIGDEVHENTDLIITFVASADHADLNGVAEVVAGRWSWSGDSSLNPAPWDPHKAEESWRRPRRQ